MTMTFIKYLLEMAPTGQADRDRSGSLRRATKTILNRNPNDKRGTQVANRQMRSMQGDQDPDWVDPREEEMEAKLPAKRDKNMADRSTGRNRKQWNNRSSPKTKRTTQRIDREMKRYDGRQFGDYVHQGGKEYVDS